MTLLRTGDFRQEDAVAEGFMRSIVVRENEDPIRFAKHVFGSGIISGAVRSVVSIAVEDEDGTVFAGNFDCVGGIRALVEQVETRLLLFGWNPFADGLPRRFDGIEGVDVEGWVRWWWDVDDRLMSLPVHPAGCLRQSMSAPLAFPKSVQPEEEFDFSSPEKGVHDIDSVASSGSLTHPLRFRATPSS